MKARPRDKFEVMVILGVVVAIIVAAVILGTFKHHPWFIAAPDDHFAPICYYIFGAGLLSWAALATVDKKYHPGELFVCVLFGWIYWPLAIWYTVRMFNLRRP